MGGFEELGKKLDKLAKEIKTTTQARAEKTVKEAKEWGKKLDELGEGIKKTVQEGLGKFVTETKGLGQAAKLRLQIREEKKDIEEIFRQIGEKAYELHLQKKIGNVELKKLGAKVTKLKKNIRAKEKQIRRLRSGEGKEGEK